jgi:hypothetical protein
VFEDVPYILNTSWRAFESMKALGRTKNVMSEEVLTRNGKNLLSGALINKD